MGNRGHVFDQADLESGGLQSADRGFAAGARAFDVHINALQTMLHSRFGSGFGSGLRREGSGFPRTAEAQLTGARPGQRVALRIGDGHDGIVKGGLDMSSATLNILAFLRAVVFAAAILIPPAYFFLLAIVFFGPLRVRALVLER